MPDAALSSNAIDRAARLGARPPPGSCNSWSVRHRRDRARASGASGPHRCARVLEQGELFQYHRGASPTHGRLPRARRSGAIVSEHRAPLHCTGRSSSTPSLQQAGACAHGVRGRERRCLKLWNHSLAPNQFISSTRSRRSIQRMHELRRAPRPTQHSLFWSSRRPTAAQCSS